MSEKVLDPKEILGQDLKKNEKEKYYYFWVK